MKHVFLSALLLLSASLLIISCHCKKKSTSAATTVPSEVKRDFEKEGYVKATVINFELDGCKFMLKLEADKKLEPTNLSADFQKDQLAVWVKYVLKKNGMSICMAGEMVEITDIQLRK